MSHGESGGTRSRASRIRIMVLVALLAFVAVSVGYLIYTQTRQRPGTPAAEAATRPDTTTVVYYFYTNVRCDSCRRIEQWTGEALKATFAAELADGRVEWRPVNVEEKGNEHFIEDFRLKAKTVVVTRVVDGKVAKWVDLIQVWELLANQDRFTQFIAENVRRFLEQT